MSSHEATKQHEWQMRNRSAMCGTKLRCSVLWHTTNDYVFATITAPTFLFSFQYIYVLVYSLDIDEYEIDNNNKENVYSIIIWWCVIAAVCQRDRRYTPCLGTKYEKHKEWNEKRKIKWHWLWPKSVYDAPWRDYATYDDSGAEALKHKLNSMQRYGDGDNDNDDRDIFMLEYT